MLQAACGQRRTCGRGPLAGAWRPVLLQGLQQRCRLRPQRLLHRQLHAAIGAGVRKVRLAIRLQVGRRHIGQVRGRRGGGGGSGVMAAKRRLRRAGVVACGRGESGQEQGGLRTELA